ncbi:MAG: TetR/AcrR family transcriptional regulator [Armatimonadetes bacterium]|nr:TetR/AcrR family transcriptional regulator [Armatimonadota bacterium]
MTVRNRRRKEARPEEITEAALRAFAEKGYADTRLDDVARSAGISKGTIYLYFPSKDELFKAVVRRSVVPLLEALQARLERLEGSTEQFLRQELKGLLRSVLETDARHVVRLIVSEGHRFPDLTEFYFREVVRRGLESLQGILARGEERGEFRPTGLKDAPQLLLAPALMALLWKSTFEAYRPLDLEHFLDTHIDILMDGLRPL